jgi:hypothetical protein
MESLESGLVLGYQMLPFLDVSAFALHRQGGITPLRGGKHCAANQIVFRQFNFNNIAQAINQDTAWHGLCRLSSARGN